jgi:transposase-like protein
MPSSILLMEEDDCALALEAVRWPKGLLCPRCRSDHIRRFEQGTASAPRRRRYRCLDCSYQYSVTAGTIFHKSHLPLKKWFLAVDRITSDLGLTARDLQRELNLGSYKTAWHILRSVKFEAAEDPRFMGALRREIRAWATKFR